MGDGTQCSLEENEILEGLNYDLDVPCPLQWGLLWFSSPSRLDRNFAHDGLSHVKDCTRPRTCLLRTVGAALCNSPDKDGCDEKEMKGWGLEKCPLLLPYDYVSDDDLSHV